jgi:hypothetical protein
LPKSNFEILKQDVLPNISITNTNNDKKKYSYDLKKSNTCLLFNFIDQKTVKDENVDCTLTYPGREFREFQVEDDRLSFDKVLEFGVYNIILKKGLIYFAKHDGETFVTFMELSKQLDILAGKNFIDILSFQRSDNPYILCHTEFEIIVFIINFKTTFEFDIIYTIYKTKENGLKYNSIVSFGANEKSLLIVYKEVEIAYTIVYKDKSEVVRSQILDSDKKPLKIYDAKVSTATGHIFIIVNGKGICLQYL